MYPRDRRKFAVEVPISADMPDVPDDYASYAIHQAKKTMLAKLQQGLWHDRWWAIRIHEEWPTEYEIWQARRAPRIDVINLPTYKIYFEIKEIASERIVMPEPIPMYESWSTRKVSMTALEELTKRIKNKFRRTSK